MSSYASADAFLSEYGNTLKAFRQFILEQREMGNENLPLSDHSLALINNWGNPSLRPALKFQGPETAKVYFIDSEGTFFSGPAGALLVKIISAMHLDSAGVFICDCQNMAPVFDLIKKNRPSAVVTLGDEAARSALRLRGDIGPHRSRFLPIDGSRVISTFHPRDLLKDPSLKRQVWTDMQKVMAIAGLSHAG